MIYHEFLIGVNVAKRVWKGFPNVGTSSTEIEGPFNSPKWLIAFQASIPIKMGTSWAFFMLEFLSHLGWLTWGNFLQPEVMIISSSHFHFCHCCSNLEHTLSLCIYKLYSGPWRHNGVREGGKSYLKRALPWGQFRRIRLKWHKTGEKDWRTRGQSGGGASTLSVATSFQGCLIFMVSLKIPLWISG